MSNSIASKPAQLRAVGPYTLDTNAETLDIITQLAEQFGDIVKIRSADRKNPSYLVNHPDWIKHILVSNRDNYVKGVGFERVEMLLGSGIIVSSGKVWRRQRTMIQPAFSRGNIAKFFAPIKEINERLAEDWGARAADEATIDLTQAMSELGLEIIVRSILSDDFDRMTEAVGENPFAFLTEDMSRTLTTAMKFRESARLVQKSIERRRESGQRPFDFLSMMMDAKDKKTGAGMDDKQLVDEVKTLIIAGHETSAGTLNWAWYLLSQHPEVEEELLAEITPVMERGELRFEAVAELKFTRQVLEETLRLYPPVWLFTRKAIDDDEIAGQQVPAGADIFISPYLIQRHPEYWVNPHAFQPHRFDAAEIRTDNRYAFIPFSAGPRRCIGEYFSFVEMQTHLAILASRFRARHVPDRPVELDPAINLRSKHSILMQIEKR